MPDTSAEQRFFRQLGGTAEPQLSDSALQELAENRYVAKRIKKAKVLIIDEIHLLTDVGRGPTLEVLITILRDMLPKLQLIGLSATIGNPKELAAWLGARLVEDSWRPVRLDKGIYFGGRIEFY